MDIVLYCLAIVIAAVITGLLGYFMVPFLHKIKFGQTIREVGPSWHKNKQGTPTMGGIMFIIGSSVAAVICIAFLWLNGGAETQLMFVKVVAGALMAVGFGIVGFLDDYISIKKHRNLGLTEIQKLILQFIIVGAYLLSVALAGGTTETVIPFLGSVDLGFFYYILAAVFIVGPPPSQRRELHRRHRRPQYVRHARRRTRLLCYRDAFKPRGAFTLRGGHRRCDDRLPVLERQPG